jgi:ferredoxin
MKTTQDVPCPHCYGRGEVLDDDNDMIVCGVCMGMKCISIDLPPTVPAIPEEAWYREPQPARMGRAEL